ncbi:MAG: DUF2461 domain-containing protein [Bacteroidales bacterium]|nr:DUF2461 domain-containing protein [Bacteroidales bacterium]
MEEVIAFLKDLRCNNNREWFTANKSRYIAAQERFNAIVDELIREISLFDDSVIGLTARDCTYRIYRDVRFSADKSPYKTHMGAFICPGGRKSGNSGYYFHIGTGGEGYPYAHMLAAGDYCCDSKVLQILREDIVNGDGDFDRIVRAAAPMFVLDREGSLKRNPKGFEREELYADYLRLKAFCLVHIPTDEFVCADKLPHRVASLFSLTKPFLFYLNRAIAYVKNEY